MSPAREVTGCPVLNLPAPLARPQTSEAALFALAALCYACFAVLFQVFPPFFDEVENEFEIGRTLTSLTMTSFLAPLALCSFLLGAACDRHGSAAVGRLGFLLLLAGGAATIAAPSYALLLAGRALAGLGGGMVLVAVLKLLAASVPAERLGIAFGVFIAGLPVGTGIAFDLLNHLPSWRASAAVSLVLVALGAAAFWALVPARGAARRTASLRADLGACIGAPAIRQLALLVALGYAAIVAFTTWAPTRLESYAGLAAGTASLIASVLLVIDIPFAPFWGRVSDHVGRRKPFVVAAFLVYAAGAFLVPSAALAGAVPLVLVVGAMGIGCAMFFPATLAIPQALVPEARPRRGLRSLPHRAGARHGPRAPCARRRLRASVDARRDRRHRRHLRGRRCRFPAAPSPLTPVARTPDLASLLYRPRLGAARPRRGSRAGTSRRL